MELDFLDPHQMIQEILFSGQAEFDILEEGVFTKEDIAAGKEWLKNNPISHENVVHHFMQATEAEKHNGKHWYADAHTTMKAVAKDTETPLHTMAGLVANYSPQTHWYVNIHTAARVAKHKRGMGGPGSGVFASSQQRDAANRMLTGEHYDDVLAGHKVRHFAHLIEHGGNADETNPRVVVDRHALSVASGSRVPDHAFAASGLSKSKKKYETVAKTYHDATKKINEMTGENYHPHQIQAITWLVRQRLNAKEDKSRGGRGSNSAGTAQKHKEKWTSYAQEHHPMVIGQEPGTGYHG